jgi:hypothetical protein
MCKIDRKQVPKFQNREQIIEDAKRPGNGQGSRSVEKGQKKNPTALSVFKRRREQME